MFRKRRILRGGKEIRIGSCGFMFFCSCVYDTIYPLLACGLHGLIATLEKGSLEGAFRALGKARQGLVL